MNFIKVKDFIFKQLDKVFFVDPAVPQQQNQTMEEKNLETNTSTRHIAIQPEALSSEPVKSIHQKQKNVPEKKKDYWWDFQGHPETDAPVFEILTDDRVVQELNRKLDCDEFPVIEVPSNVMKAMKILNKSDFEYTEIADLISHSPAMAGEFIKTLNSALFFRGETISDLKIGLPRLGKENIKGMLYVYSSKMNFSDSVLFNDLAKNIVDHCYAVGILASHLGQTYYSNPEEAFLAGLLHDIGKLGILKSLTETYELPETIDFEVSEDVFDDIFPEIHPRAGKYLATNWKIEEDVIFAIENHHNIDNLSKELEESEVETGNKKQLCALINITDTIVRILGYGRRIDKVNIFDTQAAKILSMIPDNHTLSLLDGIPKMLSIKLKDEQQEK